MKNIWLMMPLAMILGAPMAVSADEDEEKVLRRMCMDRAGQEKIAEEAMDEYVEACVKKFTSEGYDEALDDVEGAAR